MRSMILPGGLFLFVSFFGVLPLSAARAVPQKKEYLSESEADKIRDAGATGPRIQLYAMFASDRIKKIKYELGHIDPADQKRADRMNALILGYTGCIDDAADLIEEGIERQDDIQEGVKAMRAGIKEFLPYLQDLAKNGAEHETYKSNLDDAIDATEDAQKDVDNASKDMPAPPVRRKPS